MCGTGNIFGVLILVLMEDTLGELNRENRNIEIVVVLILVLMEDTLGVWWQLECILFAFSDRQRTEFSRQTAQPARIRHRPSAADSLSDGRSTCIWHDGIISHRFHNAR